jgi:hypothetical protein
MEIQFGFSYYYSKKQRAKHYDLPLTINGTFDHVIKLSVTNPDKPKEKAVKKKK